MEQMKGIFFVFVYALVNKFLFISMDLFLI